MRLQECIERQCMQVGGGSYLEEGIWLVGSLFHSLEQGKMTPLVVFYVLPYLGQQHQSKEPLGLQMEQNKN